MVNAAKRSRDGMIGQLGGTLASCCAFAARFGIKGVFR
jgi:hypothetical protein